MECAKCGKDYAEQFESGTKCFGCGYFDSIPTTLCGKNKSKKPVDFDLVYSVMGKHDYHRIQNKWGIIEEQANQYGLFKAQSKIDDRTWIMLPVHNKYGLADLIQMRAWDGQHETRFYTCRAHKEVPDGVVWRSWYTQEGDQKMAYENFWTGMGGYDFCAIVEGIPDGIRVGRYIPTIALLGSAPDDPKVAEILSDKSLHHARFVIMLDPDAGKKALDLQKKLGVTRATVVTLVKDPADLTNSEIADKLYLTIGDEHDSKNFRELQHY